jgi:hypothetical protein
MTVTDQNLIQEEIKKKLIRVLIVTIQSRSHRASPPFLKCMMILDHQHLSFIVTSLSRQNFVAGFAYCRLSLCRRPNPPQLLPYTTTSPAVILKPVISSRTWKPQQTVLAQKILIGMFSGVVEMRQTRDQPLACNFPFSLFNMKFRELKGTACVAVGVG